MVVVMKIWQRGKENEEIIFADHNKRGELAYKRKILRPQKIASLYDGEKEMEQFRGGVCSSVRD